ncbi:hypothetical protein [Sorangium sp. So ce1389]|uniref:hypothetical protein n=1 Tax=Sorangium sp. So ce1389 TaxID=3133336 RepID=UPI003F5FE58F
MAKRLMMMHLRTVHCVGATVVAAMLSFACGGGGSGPDEPIGTLDNEQDYARFMHAIALPLVVVLGDLEDRTTVDDPAACSGGGTAAIDRALGQVTFSACQLGGITITGTAVLAQGASAGPDKSAFLAGAQLAVSGGATGMVLMQLAELTWQDPPTEAGTTWKASFDNGMSVQICVQSSGEPCSEEGSRD